MSEKSWSFLPIGLEAGKEYNLEGSGEWVSLGNTERADYYLVEPIFNLDTQKLIFLHKNQEGKIIDTIMIEPSPPIESREEATEFCNLVNEQLPAQLLQEPTVNARRAFSFFSTLMLTAQYLDSRKFKPCSVDNIIPVNLGYRALVNVPLGSAVILVDDLNDYPIQVLEKQILDDKTVAAVNPKTGEVVVRGKGEECLVLKLP